MERCRYDAPLLSLKLGKRSLENAAWKIIFRLGQNQQQIK
jgi:hypothetical protein